MHRAIAEHRFHSRKRYEFEDFPPEWSGLNPAAPLSRDSFFLVTIVFEMRHVLSPIYRSSPR
jgi:hypothetical protein